MDDPAFQESRGRATRLVHASHPAQRLTLNTLAAFLLKLNPDNATMLSATPEFAIQGALVYQARGCSDCHFVNGAGTESRTVAQRTREAAHPQLGGGAF